MAFDKTGMPFNNVLLFWKFFLCFHRTQNYKAMYLVSYQNYVILLNKLEISKIKKMLSKLVCIMYYI